MTRIARDLDHPTRSSNAVGDDSVVGHPHLQRACHLIRLADLTSDGSLDVAKSVAEFPLRNGQRMSTDMRYAAKLLTGAKLKTHTSNSGQAGSHGTAISTGLRCAFAVSTVS